MEVKSVYMDLQEGVKKGNVWKLESEAFKKPIEIKIGYDNHELAEFNRKYDNLYSAFQSIERELNLWNKENIEQDKVIKELQNKVNELDKRNQNLFDLMLQKDEEINSLYKVIADLKTTVETLSGTTIHLQEQTKLIQQKITEQPTVIHDKCFISGRESSGLGMIELRDGDYLMIMKIKIGEHNEYVINQDEILFDKIHVEGQHYVPFYQLYGGTELDTPTATIYYDLIFIPM